jgi:PilZ domain
MTRRDAVRIVLFERASLAGRSGGVRCAVVDLSALGALVTITARVPSPPLRLEFDIGGEALSLPVEIRRVAEGNHVAVAFVDPPVDLLHRLIAVEQRRALAAGRLNVRGNGARPPRGAARGEVLPPEAGAAPD